MENDRRRQEDREEDKRQTALQKEGEECGAERHALLIFTKRNLFSNKGH